MAEKDITFEHCKILIENKLAWGSSQAWTNRDFAELGERIFSETGVQLSVTTLKRLWGKIEYNSAPHPGTLDVLAVFAGFENWRELKLKGEMPPSFAPKTQTKKPVFDKKQIVLIGLAAGAVYVLAWLWISQKQPIPGANFSFSSRPLSVGIPNSVVFKYDASAAPPGDSIFIQQSWDARRRKPVTRQGREHTSIYYRPGIFMAKLVVGDKTVREHRLFIPTDGWLAYIEQSPVPVYLERAVFDRDTCLEVLPETVAAHNIPLQPNTPTVCITDVRQRDSLTTADFLFEAEVRSLYRSGAAICQMTEVILLTSRGPLVLPLAEPGCVGALVMHIPHRNIAADEADLSGFGCDLSRWTLVRCWAKPGGNIFVEVNGKPAYSFAWPSASSEIIGSQFNFTGGGAVRRVRLGKS
ncbi:MAG: hypothetical protein ABMA02_08125 [Saprospiraceae bacterium]